MTTEYFFWQGARYKAIGSTTPLQAELHFATRKCDGDGDATVAVTVVDVIVRSVVGNPADWPVAARGGWAAIS